MNWHSRQLFIMVLIVSSFGGCVKHAFAQVEPKPAVLDAPKPKEIRCTESQFEEIQDICSEVTDDDQEPKCIQDAIKLKCVSL